MKNRCVQCKPRENLFEYCSSMWSFQELLYVKKSSIWNLKKIRYKLMSRSLLSRCFVDRSSIGRLEKLLKQKFFEYKFLEQMFCEYTIEEGLSQKTWQRSSRLFWGQNLCHTSCFAPQTVKLSWSIWNKQLNSASVFGINS